MCKLKVLVHTDVKIEISITYDFPYQFEQLLPISQAFVNLGQS